KVKRGQRDQTLQHLLFLIRWNKEGYGQKKYLDKQHPDWNIVEEGTWKEGVFQSGILRYEYKKSVQ
ncbi:MAG: hypothetical protein ACLVIY_11680, partial [Anaerobutyricum soehngenii]